MEGTWNNPAHHHEEAVLHREMPINSDGRKSNHVTSAALPIATSRTVGRWSGFKKICIVAVLLVILVCAIAIPLALRNGMGGNKSKAPESNGNPNPFSTLVTACAATLYPTVCYDSLVGNLLNKSGSGSNARDMLRYAIKAATDSVNQELTQAEELLNNTSGVDNVIAQDCVMQLRDSEDTLAETLDGLNNLSVQHLDDDLANLQTWMSSALTTQQTCLDTFDDLGINVTNGPVGELLRQGNYTLKLISNALAFVTTLQGVAGNIPDIPKLPGNRRLLSSIDSEDDLKFTRKFFSRFGDFGNVLKRQLLQTSNSPSGASVVVAKDRTGNFTRVQDAVNQAPRKSKTQYVIYIKSGKYVETVNVPKNATNIVFLGDGIGKTIISGSLSVIGSGVTTSLTPTLTVQGKNFVGRNLTVENTAGAVNHQAVAMRVTGDFAAFERCEFLGFQDTLYTHTNRQFYQDCTVVGTVDFIFGNAAVIFQTSQILATAGLPGQQNTYTASGRIDPNQNTGISFQECSFDGTASLQNATNGTFPTYLGRPWKPYATTVVMHSTLGAVLNPAGWLIWDANTSQHFSTIYYAEYQNNGPGSGTSQRVSWSKQITKVGDAQKFAVNSFLQGGSWLPQTKISYTESV